MMNWYKLAILIDKKAPSDEMSINMTCMYCGRWATNPSQINPSNQDTYIWKTDGDLDSSEKAESDKVLIRENWASHGICPYCMSILKSMDYWPEVKDFETIKQKSLEMG